MKVRVLALLPLLPLLPLLIASPAVARHGAPPKRLVAPSLGDSSSLVAVVRDLASPDMEGRGVGTRGLERAADYLALRFRALGLLPAGEAGSYFQSFEVTTGVKVIEPSRVEVHATRAIPGPDFQPLGFSANGIAAAPVVFAGYGIVAPEHGYDDYAGLDARDKLVLVLRHEPGEMDSTSVFDGTVDTPHAELRTKAIVAREHGALGLLVVTGPRYHDDEEMRAPRLEGGYMTGGLVAAQVSRALAARLLARSGKGLSDLQTVIDSTLRPHSMALDDSARVTVTLERQRARIRNVIGRLPGRDSTRTLVVGAHYDHLGYGGESSLAPRQEGTIHPGADDNASGVAALLHVASVLTQRERNGGRPVHDVIFCAFTGEEMGLVGSSHYVDSPVRPLQATESMVNMDMVGRLRQGKLIVMGVGTAREFPELLEHVNRSFGLSLKSTLDGFGPSDHSSFYKRHVPVLALFTGAHADYHKPSDTWDKVSGGSVWKVAEFAAALMESLDARPRVSYLLARGDSTTGPIRGGGGYGAYLGTIPDYTQTEGGVLLSGVREASPAARAGLQGGDVIVKFDDVKVDNIYDYTYALRSRKPGQEVRITVQRGGEPVTLVATLGRRPS